MDKEKLKQILEAVLTEVEKMTVSSPLAHVAVIALRWLLEHSGILENAAKTCAAKGF